MKFYITIIVYQQMSSNDSDNEYIITNLETTHISTRLHTFKQVTNQKIGNIELKDFLLHSLVLGYDLFSLKPKKERVDEYDPIEYGIRRNDINTPSNSRLSEVSKQSRLLPMNMTTLTKVIGITPSQVRHSHLSKNPLVQTSKHTLPKGYSSQMTIQSDKHQRKK